MTQESDIEATILLLAGERGANSSICPSEAARALATDWRPLLGPVRRSAARLSRDGRIDILRKGRPIDPGDIKGVIRLRIRPDGTAQ